MVARVLLCSCIQGVAMLLPRCSRCLLCGERGVLSSRVFVVRVSGWLLGCYYALACVF